MADIGKAYVQIVPSAKGITGSISKVLNSEANSAGTSSGGEIGSSLGAALKSTLLKYVSAAAIGAAIVKGISASMTQGAALEQSLGGVETMFKKNASIVETYAKQAYQSAGISANQYMEQVTSFSASLINSLGGNTKKAAEYANTAITDMADNSNKFGTSMEDIQNAYQGFAKQNYTMLDNLKLGYGGTKAEMERLLEDAEKLTGKKYDVSNFSDITQAIHAIQTELGVTGTTAEEAEHTFSGSFNSMKAAANDFLAALSTTGSDSTLFDLSGSMQNLLDSFNTFMFGNFIPMAGRILVNLPVTLATYLLENIDSMTDSAVQMMENLGSGLEEGIPNLLAKAIPIVTQLSLKISQNATKLLAAGIKLLGQLAQGIINSIPELLQNVPTVLQALAEQFTTRAPTLLSTGLEVMKQLATGILQALPEIISALLQITVQIGAWALEIVAKGLELGIDFVTNIVTWFAQLPGQLLAFLTTIISNVASFVSNMISKAVQVGSQFLSNIINYISQLPGNISSSLSNVVSQAVSFVSNFASKGIEAARNFVSNITSGLAGLPGRMASVGSDIVSGIINGISGAAGRLTSRLKGLATDALNAAKSALGINSPSREFRDQVGQWIPAGIAIGIERDHSLDKAIDGMANEAIREAQYDLNNLGMAVNYSTISNATLADSTGANVINNNFNQTINSAKTLRPSEIAQEAKNLQRRMAWV